MLYLIVLYCSGTVVYCIHCGEFSRPSVRSSVFGKNFISCSWLTNVIKAKVRLFRASLSVKP